jgi:hypothetical protein
MLGSLRLTQPTQRRKYFMTAKMRNCAGTIDFPAISDFLYTLYQPNNSDGNWFQSIWEYAYTHSFFDEESVDQNLH